MKEQQSRNNRQQTSKEKQLEQFTVSNDGKPMTTNQGVPVSEDEHSLKAGVRGPTLMEDFHFREKMTHLTMSGFRRGSSMHADSGLTVIFRYMSR